MLAKIGALYPGILPVQTIIETEISDAALLVIFSYCCEKLPDQNQLKGESV